MIKFDEGYRYPLGIFNICIDIYRNNQLYMVGASYNEDYSEKTNINIDINLIDEEYIAGNFFMKGDFNRDLYIIDEIKKIIRLINEFEDFESLSNFYNEKD